MTAEEVAEFFWDNKKIHKQLRAMIEAGLSYLTLGQPLSTLSGGERQRVKLAKHLDKKGNIICWTNYHRSACLRREEYHETSGQLCKARQHSHCDRAQSGRDETGRLYY